MACTIGVMAIDGVDVHGESGQPVLLLPGGSEACAGFFPGLVEGLRDDCRVIVHDRPGTGASAEPGVLAGAAEQLGSLIDRLGCGPVVVVGQSLGGAVAVLLARRYPEKVAGLVLLDPTPINDPRSCRMIERMMQVLGGVAKVPVARKALAAVMRASVRRQVRKHHLRPDCAEAMARTAELDTLQLAAAVRGLHELSVGLEESALPQVQGVVVTADRKPSAAIRQAHERLAAAFGMSVACWPGATHSVHLDHPDETLAVVRDVVAAVEK